MSADASLIRRIVLNDLRIFWRALDRRRFGTVASTLMKIGFVGLMHLPVFSMLYVFGRGTGGADGAAFACGLVSIFILTAGLQRSLEVLYNRGDLPLFLTSPVPARVVVATRMIDITVTTWISTALIVLPILDAATFLYGAHWLWGWLAWIAGCTLFGSLALFVTVGVVKLMGARRARTVIQITGIVIGMSAVLGLQAPRWFFHPGSGRNPMEVQRMIFSWFNWQPLPFLAEAARGAPIPLGAMVCAALVSATLALTFLRRQFITSAQSAAADVGSAEKSSANDPAHLERLWKRSFKRGRWSALVAKEIRLFWRDPMLITHSSIQIISLAPALIGIAIFQTTAGVASFGFVGSAIVAVTIANLITANDESADFTSTSPLPVSRAAIARTLAAGMYPALVGCLASIAVLALGSPLLAIATLVGSTYNAVAMAWFSTCLSRPRTPEERAQNKPMRIPSHAFFAMLVGGLGAGAVSAWSAHQHILGIGLYLAALGAASLGFIAQPRKFANI